MVAITSRQNDKIKLARALQRRKTREAEGLFLIEGTFHLGEAAAGWPLDFVLYAPDQLHSPFAARLLEELQAKKVDCFEVSSEVMDSLTSKEHSQGLLAVARQKFTPLAALVSQPTSFYVAVVTPQDPGNLGSLLRTIDAAGADGLLLLDGGVDAFHPSAVRAGMGAHFSKPIIQAGFGDLVAWAQEAAVQLVGSSAHAEADYRRAAYRTPLVLLLGSERQGLSPEQATACDPLVRLPMHGRTTSLNLAVAAGILIYAICDRLER